MIRESSQESLDSDILKNPLNARFGMLMTVELFGRKLAVLISNILTGRRSSETKLIVIRLSLYFRRQPSGIADEKDSFCQKS